jgi:hypothetical protein
MNIDKINADNFYKDNGDKIKQNWLLYEYANILYSKIEESHELTGYRKKHSIKNISAFCVYFSKRLKQSLFKAQNEQMSGVAIDARYVYEFYPENTRTQTQKLLNVSMEAWDEHLRACSNCPNQCLTDGFEITDMFDNLETREWPTV